VQQYFDSAEFKVLDARTRYVRRQILDTLCQETVSPDNSAAIGSLPFATMRLEPAICCFWCYRLAIAQSADLARRRSRRLQSSARGALHQDRITGTLRQVFAFGINSGFHTCTIEEVRQHGEHHPIGTRARLAQALLLSTGQRRSDVVRFGRQHVKDGWLNFTQSKNRNRKPVTLSIPMLPELQAVLDATAASNMTFLVTEFGKPFMSNGFGTRFRKWCDEAGLPHVSAHGLRKAGAGIAAENDATERRLMAIFDWSTMKEAANYTRTARKKVLAASAMPLPISNQREAK
jgi:integrase